MCVPVGILDGGGDVALPSERDLDKRGSTLKVLQLQIDFWGMMCQMWSSKK